MDKLDKELGKILKSEVTIPSRFEKTIKYALKGERVKSYKDANSYNFVKIAATFIITCVCGISAVFAGVSTYNYLAKSSYQKVNVVPGSDPEIDAKYGIIKSDGSDYIYYKKISTYDDYKKCKEIWTDLYDMNESDFEDYFIVMVSVAKATKLPYYISNVNSDNTTLYIEISQSEDEIVNDNHKTFFSIKIEKEHNRENIKIKEMLITPNADANKYIDIKKIANEQNYSKEQAINEGCFVISAKNEVLSNDINQMRNFVKNTADGKAEFIRIAMCNSLGEVDIVRDIEYKNGKYYTAVCHIYNKDYIKLTYNSFDKLTEHYSSFDKINWLYEIVAEDNEETGTSETIVAYK